MRGGPFGPYTLCSWPQLCCHWAQDEWAVAPWALFSHEGPLLHRSRASVQPTQASAPSTPTALRRPMQVSRPGSRTGWEASSVPCWVRERRGASSRQQHKPCVSPEPARFPQTYPPLPPRCKFKGDQRRGGTTVTQRNKITSSSPTMNVDLKQRKQN